MLGLDDLKTLFPISLEAKDVEAHIKRASLDFEGMSFSKDLELEIIGSRALYYLAPLLWVQMQNRVNEYEESLQTFKDLEKFQFYWLKRSNDALDNLSKTDKVKYTCI